MSKKTNKRIVLITHNDLDGAGCSVVFKMMAGNEVYYEDYSTINARIINVIASKPDMIFIADISPTNTATATAIYEAIKKGGIQIKVIDHHKTALEKLSGWNWAHINMDMCGAKLLYHFLCRNGYFDEEKDDDTTLSDFVDMVDDYDRWVHKDPNSMKLNTLFKAYGMDAFVTRCITKRIPSEFNDTDAKIVEIFTLKDEEYSTKVIEAGEIWDGINGKVLVVFAETCQSLIGDKCRKMKIKCDYVAIVDLHHRKVSLRAVKKGFNVATIASRSGGGGHIGSAGFEIIYNDVMKIVEGLDI